MPPPIYEGSGIHEVVVSVCEPLVLKIYAFIHRCHVMLSRSEASLVLKVEILRSACGLRSG